MHAEKNYTHFGVFKNFGIDTAGLDPQPQVDAHEKSIYQQIERATTYPRPRIFQNNFPNNVQTKIDKTEPDSPR